jgi:hypothetical protein
MRQGINKESSPVEGLLGGKTESIDGLGIHSLLGEIPDASKVLDIPVGSINAS